jgi:hypothetical protein
MEARRSPREQSLVQGLRNKEVDAGGGFRDVHFLCAGSSLRLAVISPFESTVYQGRYVILGKWQIS